ncbi:hypothetical protein XA68_10962 [Ophiocordyceps unilateralis]|uniref:Uncharacterized protein n=1 Tax=Ophiocordyceps unilateralis TaxID=268505 RepID=A0A2A9NXY0_OPHUN|nr:hypothetical protein XA68_10962 [Ophiocordyceps unilateralis]
MYASPALMCLSNTVLYRASLFMIQDSECVVAVRQNGQRSKMFRFEHPGLEDDLCGVAYRPCWWMPCSHGEKAIGCHVECVNVETSGSREIFNDATAYAYDSPLSEDTRRARWLQSDLASVLEKTLPLPVEICNMAARYGAREHAVQITRTLRPKESNSDFSVSIAADIWARYVEFEGVSYIATLANEPGGSSTPAIHTPRSGQVVDVLYIAKNHLGIRQVLFCNTSEVPVISERQGVWWKALHVSKSDPTVRGQTDGLKLRSLKSTIEPRSGIPTATRRL